MSPQESNLNQALDPSFLLGDLDNLVGVWDDRIDGALSDSVKSPSSTQELRIVPPQTDATDLQIISPIFPSASINLSRISNEREDSIASEDFVDHQPLFPAPQSLREETDIPPRDCLYSTPLSWERPEPGCRVDQSNCHVPLSPEEESRLRSIAMPEQSWPVRTHSPSHKTQGSCNSRKLKSSGSSQSDNIFPLPRSRHTAPQKAAHNMIEKRYRTNLNDRIAALRDSVPSLRAINEDNQCGDDLHEGLQGLSPAQKINKLSIHFHSLSYILTPQFLSYSSIASA
jgi:hypothetical protein